MGNEILPFGIKETKEAISEIIALANAGDAAAKDGKIDFADLPLLIGIVPKIQPAIDGSGLIPKELGDLSSAEAAELISQISVELVIGDVKAKEIISQSLETIASIAKLVQKIRA
jgi:hypothetical protein